MQKVVILDVGVEGGGATVYGRQQEGIWLFWQEGSSMFLNENDDEAWRSWNSEPAAELTSVLPDKWYAMYPIEVHPDFIASLHRAYDQFQSRQTAEEGREGGMHHRWREVYFASPPGT